jgi:hypothetical protein
VSLHQKLGLAAVSALLVAGPSLAQGVGVGATIGVVNDIGGKFHIDEFKKTDANLWVDYEVEDKTLVRLMLGTLHVKGANAGKDVISPVTGDTITLPDLTEHIDYATLGVSYQLLETGFTSGIFAGLGAYRVRPESAPEEIANFRDQRETAFGFNAGVEGGFQLVSRLSFQMRLTYHNIRSESGRSLLTANAGFGFRF